MKNYNETKEFLEESARKQGFSEYQVKKITESTLKLMTEMEKTPYVFINEEGNTFFSDLEAAAITELEYVINDKTESKKACILDVSSIVNCESETVYMHYIFPGTKWESINENNTITISIKNSDDSEKYQAAYNLFCDALVMSGRVSKPIF